MESAPLTDYEDLQVIDGVLMVVNPFAAGTPEPDLI